MRYMIWFLAALGDILIIGASAIVIYLEPRNPVGWIVVALGFRAWYTNGGFEAWHPKTIRAFLANAKKYGL